MRTTTLGRAAAALATLLLTLTFADPARADPPFVPDGDDLIGVGSQVTQALMNDLAAAYDATGPIRRLASYDTTGSPTIPGGAGAPLPRPVSTQEGLVLLKDPAGVVDFVRSVRPPGSFLASLVSGDTFYALATDRVAVAVAYDNGDGRPDTNAPVNLVLTAARLQSIYRCLPQADQWSDFVAGASTATIRPLIPPSSSDTRRFFLEQLALPDTELGTCVTQVQDGDYNTVDTDPDALVPFSEARYAETVPVTGWLGEKAIELRTGPGAFRPSRTAYTVGRTTDAAVLDPIFGPAGWICTSPQATAIITQHGFGTLGPACGATIVLP
jgi:ABC-type phosphate transport system substrate-binding protein